MKVESAVKQISVALLLAFWIRMTPLTIRWPQKVAAAETLRRCANFGRAGRCAQSRLNLGAKE
jgi:hypothetical protein